KQRGLQMVSDDSGAFINGVCPEVGVIAEDCLGGIRSPLGSYRRLAFPWKHRHGAVPSRKLGSHMAGLIVDENAPWSLSQTSIRHNLTGCASTLPGNKMPTAN